MLVECIALYGPALKASFFATYRFAYDSVPPLEAADLTAWLPEGSPLWRATGGPLSITGPERELRMVDYRLQVLAWLQTKDGREGKNQPKPPKAIPYAGEVAVEEAHAERQARARQRRSAAS